MMKPIKNENLFPFLSLCLLAALVFCLFSHCSTAITPAATEEGRVDLIINRTTFESVGIPMLIDIKYTPPPVNKMVEGILFTRIGRIPLSSLEPFWDIQEFRTKAGGISLGCYGGTDKQYGYTHGARRDFPASASLFDLAGGY